MTPEPGAPVKQEPGAPAGGRPLWLEAVLAIAEVGFAMLLVWALCLPPLYGYFAAACRNAGDATGVVMFLALVVPFALPWVVVLLAIPALAISAYLRPFRGTRFWRALHWFVLGALVAGIAGWGFALLTGASQRCSFGF